MVMTPSTPSTAPLTIRTQILHAHKNVYTLRYRPDADNSMQRYVALICEYAGVRNRSDVTVLTDPAAIKRRLEQAKKYNLHPCGEMSCPDETARRTMEAMEKAPRIPFIPDTTKTANTDATHDGESEAREVTKFRNRCTLDNCWDEPHEFDDAECGPS